MQEDCIQAVDQQENGLEVAADQKKFPVRGKQKQSMQIKLIEVQPVFDQDGHH